jgi:hypothetical protein
MKKYFVVFLFAVLAAAGISAQERGYIKPTYSLGFLAAEEFSGPAMSLELDFVNSFGLTMGLSDLFTWEGDTWAFNPISFGLGYTYNANVWSLGGKIMTVPFEVVGDGGIGLNVNFTYWFKESLGVTGIMDIAHLSYWDVSLFSMRAGISFKY